MTGAIDNSDLSSLARLTQQIYERNALRFDAERHKVLIERGWIDRFLSHLPDRGRVLDLGCGAAEPIAAYVISRGFRLTGVDASMEMLRLARIRFPQGDWRLADMRDLELPQAFDGIVGWDSFFHLTPAEQRQVLPVLAAHLRPNGALMLTVGPQEGEVVGRVGDDRVYHASLSPAEYRAILSGLDIEIVDFVPEDPDCGFHSILLARRR